MMKLKTIRRTRVVRHPASRRALRRAWDLAGRLLARARGDRARGDRGED